MRIGVNLMFLVPSEVGASELLLTRLVRAMLQSEHEFTLFCVKGFSDVYQDLSENSHIIEVPWASGAQGFRIAAENTWLAAKSKTLGLDVIHHGVGTTPFIQTIPTAVTIHDIQYRHFPRNFVKAKRIWLKINVPYTARHCEALCVPSRWVKEEVVSAFGVDPVKVHVVPFGSSDLFPAELPPPDEIRSQFGLPRDFFLYPGRAYPHKNHQFLIRAFAPLADEADLVLTGPPLFRDDEILREARRLKIEESVRHLGLVTRAELGGLFQAATALVYPSRFEGFGAPALEAMSLGCPVISSDVTSLPEVVGDAGILLDPDDLDGWSEAMSKLLADSSSRQALVDKGFARAKLFSWEEAARLQLRAYEDAMR